MARCPHHLTRDRGQRGCRVERKHTVLRRLSACLCCLMLLSVPGCLCTAAAAQQGPQHGLHSLQQLGATASHQHKEQQPDWSSHSRKPGCRHSTDVGLSSSTQQQQQQSATGWALPAFLQQQRLQPWQQPTAAAAAARSAPAAAAAARRLAQYKPSSREQQQSGDTGMPVWHVVGVALMCLIAMGLLGFSAHKAMQWLERTRRPGYVELQAMDTAYHRPWVTL